MLLVLVLAQTLVSFTTVALETTSGVEEPRTVVVRTETEWKALWAEHRAQQPAPPVDFSRLAVVGVFLGTRPTAGYGVRIVSVEGGDGRATVSYVEEQPASGTLVAQVLTSPAHLVTIPASLRSVEFKKIR